MNKEKMITEPSPDSPEPSPDSLNKIVSTLIVLLSVMAGRGSIQAQYFPTGMKWEEVNVDPTMGFEYENAHIFEIGADTLVGNVTFKIILKDNVFLGICIRENADKIWLLTKDYPTALLLYDFDWDNNEIETEYLKSLDDEGNNYVLQKEIIPKDKCQTVTINGKTYQYFRDSFIRSQIRGIGKVAELNRNQCLLGYKEMADVLPGLMYFKVHWIRRNGEEIFRSDYASEWSSEDPTGISVIKPGKITTPRIYDLQGRRINGKPSKGVYIEGGRKVLIK